MYKDIVEKYIVLQHNSNTLSDDDVWKKYYQARDTLDWANTSGSARKWWEAFETENKERPALVLRLAEELSTRKATITEFFLAYVYSNTDNIQANLNYLDYLRLKKEEEKKRGGGVDNPGPGDPPPFDIGSDEEAA